MDTKTARPSRAPAPPLFEVLDHVHRRILQALAELQDLVDRIERKGTDAAARAQARKLRDFFRDEAHRHHEEEESQVFPGLLDSRDAELIGHVRRLQQDHGWLDVDWSEIEPMLDAFAEGIGADAHSLRVAVTVYADLYRDHISIEENAVYPRARQLAEAAHRR